VDRHLGKRSDQARRGGDKKDVVHERRGHEVAEHQWLRASQAGGV
jgi:hypothetical protein